MNHPEELPAVWIIEFISKKSGFKAYLNRANIYQKENQKFKLKKKKITVKAYFTTDLFKNFIKDETTCGNTEHV